MARKPLTEAEKKAKAAQKMAEAEAAAALEKEQPAEKPKAEEQEPEKTSAVKETPSEKDDEIAALRAMVAKLQEQISQQAQQPSIIQVMGDQEKVVMMFQAEVADDNLAVFGANGMYGQVTGKTGKVIVPKNEWSRFYNESVRGMINRRWLIVLSGLTDDERQLYGCKYRDGELLESGVFNGMLDMGDELLSIFPMLCSDHQEMVARRYVSAWMDGDPRANKRDLIVKLNELSKAGRKKGLFTKIIEEMNAQDAE